MKRGRLRPLFFVYEGKEQRNRISKNSTKTHKYSHWISTYSSKEFNENVNKVISIFDEVSQNTSDIVKEKMLEAFYYSTILEWYFWNDAYHMRHVDNLI